MKYPIEELEAAYDELTKNAKPLHAFVGALIGALPATVLYFFYGAMGGALYLMLLLPPFIIGFSAKVIGRTYSIKSRISVGIVGAVSHIVGCYLAEFEGGAYLLTPVAFAIAFTFSKIKLDSLQAHAVASAKYGKIGLK